MCLAPQHGCDALAWRATVPLAELRVPAGLTFQVRHTSRHHVHRRSAQMQASTFPRAASGCLPCRCLLSLGRVAPGCRLWRLWRQCWRCKRRITLRRGMRELGCCCARWAANDASRRQVCHLSSRLRNPVVLRCQLSQKLPCGLAGPGARMFKVRCNACCDGRRRAGVPAATPRCRCS